MTIRLTLSGGQAGGLFRQCAGLGSETSVVEERDGATGEVRRLPGTTTWPEITLRRALTASLDLWNWRALIVAGDLKAARTDGTIELLDADGTVVAAYAFRRGWPARYDGPEFDAAGADLAMEEIGIAHDGLQRTV